MPFVSNCIHHEACRRIAGLIGNNEDPTQIPCSPYACRTFEDADKYARKNSLYTRSQVRSELHKAPWKYL